MDDQPDFRSVLPAIIVSLVLFAGVFIAFRSADSRPGTVIIPGGITYIGPTPTKSVPSDAQVLAAGKIPIPPDTKWVLRKGEALPYSFMIPESLSLGIFPDDPYDPVTIFYEKTDANANIFFRVEDLNRQNKKEFIGKPLEYAEGWWKDYTWIGVATVTPFTNSTGLKGYRAKYLDANNQTPFDHVFFEVPGKSDRLIWLSGKLFEQSVFDRIVDSVTWKN